MTEATPAWPDLAGRIEGGEHILAIRVYFEDTDFSGLVYHASYVRWCERGRSDYLRLLGVGHASLATPTGGERPAAFVVRRIELDYLRPAGIDDVLEVRTRVIKTSAASLHLEQRVMRGEQLLCRARVQVVLLGADGRPQRMDRLMRRLLDGTDGD